MRENKSEVVILKAPHNGRSCSIKLRHILIPAAGAILGNRIEPGLRGKVVGGLFGLAVLSLTEEDTNMAKIPVFYSFHFDNDVMRVQQIRNIGSIEGNPPTSPNEWERLKKAGDAAVREWIDQSMKYKRCLIVLIGSETASRSWVKYEIEHAWNRGKAILGIYIHNVKCPRTGVCPKGRNPFDDFHFKDGTKLSSFVPCHDPDPQQAYRDISENIASWIHSAIADKRN
jgi:hypothetical protein